VEVDVGWYENNSKKKPVYSKTKVYALGIATAIYHGQPESDLLLNYATFLKFKPIFFFLKDS